MNTTSRTCALLTFIAAVGCKTAPEQTSSSQPASTASQGPAASRSSSAPASSLSNDPKAPGQAFLSVGTYVVVLDQGKLTRVEGIQQFAEDYALGPDGSVWIAANGVYRLKGTTATKQHDEGQAIAVAPDQTVWVVGRFGAKLTTISPKGAKQDVALPAPDTNVKDVGIDAKGRVLMTDGKSVFSYDRGDWQKLDTKKAFNGETYFWQLTSYPGGALFVTSSQGIARLNDDSSWTKLVESTTLERAHVSAVGAISVREPSKAVFVEPGKKPETVGLTAVGLDAKVIVAAAVDGQGRRWIGTDGGLAILSPTGSPIQTWPVGSLPGVVGKMLLIGAGPDLPKAADEVVKGGVKGRLVLDGSPVAKATVQVCPSPETSMEGSTPCANARIKYEGKTDADGRFSFDGVLRQGYGAAYKNNGKWYVIRFPSAHPCCSDLKQGETVDVGDVSLVK